jgi:uncharacterized protein
VASPIPLKSEIRDNMRVEIDVPLVADDGVVLRADVFRPIEDGEYPTIASQGAYGKNLQFQEPPYTKLWEDMCERYPDVPEGSTNRYQAWEVCDPEKWVPHGYAVLRIDSRGAGRSDGFMNCFTTREAHDYRDWIEWCGEQPWSNGKVGLLGISYFAVNQWRVAELQPEHLAAICPWEGANDWYRDTNRHGGIHSTFLGKWFPVQATYVQYGLGSRGARNQDLEVNVSGDVDLSDEELAANRGDIESEVLEHRFDDQYYRDRSADLSKVEVPLLSAGNWGGQGLHNRGNVRGYMHSASEEKYLEIHGHEHWTLFYTDWGVDLQRRFFDWYLKGAGDWKTEQAPVTLQVRYAGERFVERAEREFPLARTAWTKLHLEAERSSLTWDAPEEERSASYRAFGAGLTFLTPPFEEEMEITGPLSCRLWMSNSTTDTDVFLALRLLDPDGNEVTWHGANEPKAPLSLGWLRASHRELDPEMSTPWMPYHPHQREQPLTPGEAYPLEIEIWTTSIVIEPAYQLALTVLGRDWDHGQGGVPSHLNIEMHGSGLWNHDDPRERPADPYDSEVTILTGGEHQSYLLLPVIPPK